MGRVAEVIVASGIPGAGKSSWIRRNTNPYMTEVFSADNYFLDRNGRYHFDPAMLSLAHCHCLRSFSERLTALCTVEDSCCPVTLVVDNTNICAWEIAPYYALAAAYGVPVRVIRLLSDPAKAFRRNIHGVEREKIELMAERMKMAELPSFWNIEEITDWY